MEINKMDPQYESASLDIVDIDDPSQNSVLTTPMDPVKFPLSREDKNFIAALKKRVIKEGAAGLAATQVGVAKPITVFLVPEEALKWRDDVIELLPLTVLINPSYEGIESKGKVLDWEGCCSAKQHYGKIWRYKAIRYKGKDEEGRDVTAEAYGFLARLLQHEIDHCNHKMCIHQYDPNSPQGTQEGLMKERRKEATKKKRALGLKPQDLFPLASQ
jgi:peptide deformylase